MINQTSAFLFLLAGVLLVHEMAEAEMNLREIMEEKRVFDCTLESKNRTGCDINSYAIRVGAESFPGIIIAIGILILWPLYLICKYYFNCCGGINQSRGFCCPVPPEGAQVIYKDSDIVRVKVFMVCCVFVVTVSTIWGVIGVADVISGFDNLDDEIGQVYDNLHGEIEQIRKDVEFDTYDAVSDTWSRMNILDHTLLGEKVYTTAINVIRDVERRTKEYTKDVIHYMKSYSIGLFFLFIVPLAVLIVGLALAFCNIRGCMPMVLMNICLLIATILWMIHTPLTASSMIVDDICTEVLAASQNKMNVLSSNFKCDSDELNVFRTKFREMESEGSKVACSYLTNFCYIPSHTALENLKNKRVFECPNMSARCPSITFAELIQLTDTSFIRSEIYNNPTAADNGITCANADWESECSFSRCAIDCKYINGSMSQLGRISEQIVTSLKKVKVVADTSDIYASRYSFCDSMVNFMLSYTNSGCQSIASGLAKARQAVGVTGIAFIAAAITLAMGSKRFMSLSKRVDPQAKKKPSKR